MTVFMCISTVSSKWCLENVAGERLQTRFAGHGLTPQRAPKQCPVDGDVRRMLRGSASRHGSLDTVNVGRA